MGKIVRLPDHTTRVIAMDAPQADVPWGVLYVGAPTAHAKGLDGDGVTIAVIDTGVSPHPCLAGRLLPGFNALAAPGSTYSDPTDTQDDNGHGTHCAGTAAASWFDQGGAKAGILGVAPKAKVLPVKVLDGTGRGDDDVVAQGIRWAADHGADVISLSLGGGTDTPAMLDALAYAAGKGVWLALAAGNSGSVPDGALTPAFDDVTAPGHGRFGIIVGALDDQLNFAYFSSEGSEVTCAAPGVNVMSLTPGGGYAFKDGTSMATPHVAGILALGKQAVRLGLAPNDPLAWIQSHAFHLGAPGRNVHYGFGLPSMLCTAPGQALRRVYFTVDVLSYAVDGTQKVADVPPTIVGDRAMVPLRAVAEAIGAAVEWHDTSRTVSLRRGDHSCSLTIDQAAATIDGKQVHLDVPPQIQNNRTLAPLRFVAEGLGAQVTWHPTGRGISVLATV